MASVAARLAFPDTMSPPLTAAKHFPTMSSLVYRFTFDLGGHPENLFVKLPADGADNRRQVARLRREYEVTQQIRNLLVDQDRLHMVNPVGYIEEFEGMVTREVAGTPLLHLIQKDLRFGRRAALPRHADLVHLAGQWLQRFHALNLHQDAADLFAHVQRFCKFRLETLAEPPHNVIQPADAKRLGHKIAEWTDEVRLHGTDQAMLCHNDYSPHNIVVNDAGIHVLDFSFATPGLPAFDVLCFWHKLEDLKSSPLYAKQGITALQEAFLAGYGQPLALESPAAKIGLTRLVLSKLLSTLKAPSRRPHQWYENRRRCKAYVTLIQNEFEQLL